MTLRELAGAALERPGARASGARVRAWCESWQAGVGLIILCLAVYLPGLWSIPPVDRDESRFAQASRTMLESGDYVVPRIQGKARLNKPPLIYWLQAASARMLGDGPGADGMGEWGNGNIWVFRVPSVLCAIGTVLLTWRLGLRMFDARAAVLGAALLGVCPMVVWDAHQARADQLLMLTTVGAMHALFVCWTIAIRTRGVARAACPPVVSVVALWVFVALGILAKGPITPMIAALTAIVLSITARNVRWLLGLRPIFGLVIVAAMVGPWVWMVGREAGWSEYWTVVWHETIGRSAEAAEGHWGPPGYHLVLLSVLLWPGSLLTAIAFGRAVRRGYVASESARRPGAGWIARVFAFMRHARPSRLPEAFLIAWVVPAWIVFELIATKLPHYTMPLYPAIALLSARGVLAAGSVVRMRTVGPRIGFFVWGAIGVVGLTLSVAVVAALGEFQQFVPSAAIWLGVVYPALLALAAWRALRALSNGKFMRAQAIGIAMIVSWCWLTLGWVAPRSPALWSSARVAKAVYELGGAARPVTLVGYPEDSAVFMFRGRAEHISNRELSDWLSAHPSGIVAVDALARPAGAQLVRASLERAASIDGYNYSVGRPVRIEVYAPRSK